VNAIGATAVPSTAAQLTHPKHRPDIDGLRAVAVLSVVAFHAFPDAVRGGFIGVDIFFVISGFLISTILFENLERGTFSFGEFYSRRVRRIFPALILVLAATMALGWAMLFNEEFQQLSKQVAAGAAFVSNFALWQESGYFDSDAVQKPLLHLWSLGVEEQFYIVWPLLVYLGWRLRANLLLLALLIAAASFGLNIAGRHADPVGTFYSPLTRFWELLSGAALAQLAQRRFVVANLKGAWADAASVVGILLIVGGCAFLTKNRLFPGWWAVIPISSSMLLIAAGPNAVLNRAILCNPAAIWFGLISYPLYLWHWPLLSYSYMTFGDPPVIFRLAVMGCATLLAFGTYRLVETPIRRSRSISYVPALAAIMVAIFAMGVIFYHSDSERITRLNNGNGLLQSTQERVLYEKTRSTSDSSCADKLHRTPNSHWVCLANSSIPRVLFVGDSHAMALYSSIYAGEISLPSALLAAHGCELYPNLEYRPTPGAEWEDCTKLAAEVIALVNDTASLRKVVISVAPASLHAAHGHRHVYLDHGTVLSDGAASLQGMGALLEALKQARKEVTFVIDVPLFGLTPARCIRGAPVVDCSLDRMSLDRSRTDYVSTLNALALAHPEVTFVDPTDLFCGPLRCSARDERRFMFADTDHLSIYGSTKLIETYLRAPLGLDPTRVSAVSAAN